MSSTSPLLSIAHLRRPSAPSKCSSASSMAWRAVLSILLLFGDVHFTLADVVHSPVRLPNAFHRPQGGVNQEEFHESSKTGHSGQLQRFFEVSKPTIVDEQPVEAIQLLYHEFANTYNIPPPSARYFPTKAVRGPDKWDKVVLKWSAVCRGRQFDLIAAVWLGGVEILRTCTAEPTPEGIIWQVEKDVTRFTSLWKRPQEVVVALGNVVDNTYTGIINVTVSVLFYRGRHVFQQVRQLKHVGDKPRRSKVEEYAKGPADVILAVKETTCDDGGCWFQLTGEADKKSTALQIPTNSYKAVLEVCVSPHGDDEFWYTNPPNEYLEANNITNVPGNGSFREVVVSIDDRVVGAVWPFVVVYTGGINPLLWRPVAAIGAFDLPSYDLDVTPFIGHLVDGKPHTFSLTVTDALPMWFLQANLHVWVDLRRTHTIGSLLEYSVPSSSPVSDSEFRGLDGAFVIRASRTVSYVGHVESSFGNLTTSSTHTLRFSNTLHFFNDSEVSTVDQLTETESMVVVNSPKREVALDRTVSSYPFYLYYRQVVNADNSANISSTIVHALNSNVESVTKMSSSFSSSSNSQRSTGEMFISANNTISGLGATKQTLSYRSTDGCYGRSVSAKNYTVLKDSSTTLCSSHPSS